MEAHRTPEVVGLDSRGAGDQGAGLQHKPGLLVGGEGSTCEM